MNKTFNKAILQVLSLFCLTEVGLLSGYLGIYTDDQGASHPCP